MSYHLMILRDTLHIFLCKNITSKIRMRIRFGHKFNYSMYTALYGRLK